MGVDHAKNARSITSITIINNNAYSNNIKTGDSQEAGEENRSATSCRTDSVTQRNVYLHEHLPAGARLLGEQRTGRTLTV